MEGEGSSGLASEVAGDGRVQVEVVIEGAEGEANEEEEDAKKEAKGGKGSAKKFGALRKVLSVELEDEDEDSWDDFSPAEMKVLVREVEMRREALFGEYKEGESPKYRWLIWQEVAEKVNEVNPCVHRNLEQVRIKWFDYKDPNNKWERRVRKKAYKHTTGMFFKRRINSLATLGDSEGEQSSSERGAGTAHGEQTTAESEGEGRASLSASEKGASKVDESLKMKGILTTLNEDKASKAIKYLSHMSQRKGIALMQARIIKEASEVIEIDSDDNAEETDLAKRKSSEDLSVVAVNPPKRTYSRSKTDVTLGVLKSILSSDASPSAVALLQEVLMGKLPSGLKEVMMKRKAMVPQSSDNKVMEEMVEWVTDYVTKEAGAMGETFSPGTKRLVAKVVELGLDKSLMEMDIANLTNGKKGGGVKRLARGKDEEGSPEAKRVRFEGRGADLTALLKTVDPSKLQQIHMKHPKTGKNVLVTKITAPEAVAALGKKISPAQAKALSEEAKVAAAGRLSGAATTSKAEVKPTQDPPSAVAAAIAPASGVQKAVGSAKALVPKDSKGSFPLLVPVGAIEKVTNSSNLLIKHPVTGKGIIISKVLKVPPTGTVAGKPTISSLAVPTGSKVIGQEGAGKTVVPIGGEVAVPVDSSNVKTVGKDPNVGSSPEKTKGPSSVAVVKENWSIVEEELSLGGDVVTEADCESSTTIGGESSDRGKRVDKSPPSHLEKTEGGDRSISESATPSTSGLQGKLSMQVVKSSGTIVAGDKAPGKVSPKAQGAKKDAPLQAKPPEAPERSGQASEGNVLLVEKRGILIGAKTISKSPTSVTKVAKGSEGKVPQGSSTTGVKAMPLQPQDLAQQILKGVGVVTKGAGPIPTSTPAKWEGGEVRMLNIGGKTVKVVLVKDEDYSKLKASKPTLPIPMPIKGGKDSSVDASVRVGTRPAPRSAPEASGKPTKDMPMIEIPGNRGETVGEAVRKTGAGDENKSPRKETSVDVSSKVVSGQGITHSTPTKEFKGFLGFPPSPTGILGAPLRSLLTTAAPSSPSVTVVTMPQKVVSVEAPQSSWSKTRKPNILSSSSSTTTTAATTKTVSSSPGVVSVAPVSNFGIKRVAPTSLQASTSKLKVRVVKDESVCRELEKKQHPLVKAALSGKPIDFQEELRKLDPLEGKSSESDSTAKANVLPRATPAVGPQSKKDGACVELNKKQTPSKAEESPKVTTELANVGANFGIDRQTKQPTVSVSDSASSPRPLIRVRSTESLRSIRIGSSFFGNNKISLSHIAVLNSVVTGGTPNNALLVGGKDRVPSVGKQRQAMASTSVGGSKSMASGLVNNLVLMKDSDDCVIVEEVDSRALDPPEVFCVDSNDSYGVEVH